MSAGHRSFWSEFLGKLGAPLFAATLVSCLLKGRLELLHGVLLAVGIGLVYVDHRWTQHGQD